MGIFSIFATKSNDIALGVPLIDAVFSGANTTKFSNYLFLFAPFQLLVLNVCGFFLLEVGRIKQEAAAEKLAAAEKRIKKLERELENRNDEIELLKKAERFFQRKK